MPVPFVIVEFARSGGSRVASVVGRINWPRRISFRVLTTIVEIVMQDNAKYLRSFADELAAQASRIRALIGRRHWLSDGTHKEYLLATQLERHLPNGVLLAKGFVADLHGRNSCSREQDLILLDTTVQAPLFHQGGLVVSTPDAVLATISVKSTMTAKTIRETIKNQNSVKSVVLAASPTRQLLTAGYFYSVGKLVEKNPDKIYGSYERGCRAHRCPKAIGDQVMANTVGPDLICAAGSLAITARSSVEEGRSLIRVSGYHCDGLAAAILITTIIEHIAAVRSKAGNELSTILDSIPMKPFGKPHHSFYCVDGQGSSTASGPAKLKRI